MREARHLFFAIALLALATGGYGGEAAKTIVFENRTPYRLEVVLLGPAELVTRQGTQAPFEPVKVLPPGQDTTFDIRISGRPASATWKAGRFSELAQSINILGEIPGDYGGNVVFAEGFFNSFKAEKRVGVYPSRVYDSPPLESNPAPTDLHRRLFDIDVILSLAALKKLQDGMAKASGQAVEARDRAWEEEVPLLLKTLWKFQVKAQDAFQRLKAEDRQPGQDFFYREELLRHLQATVVEGMLRIGESHELGLEGARKNPSLATAYYKLAQTTAYGFAEEWKGKPEEDPQIRRADERADRMWIYYRDRFLGALFRDSEWAQKARILCRNPQEGTVPIPVSPDGMWTYARIEEDGLHYKFRILNPPPDTETHIADIVPLTKVITESASSGQGGEPATAMEMEHLRIEVRHSGLSWPADIKSSWQALRVLKGKISLKEAYPDWPLSTPPERPKE